MTALSELRRLRLMAAKPLIPITEEMKRDPQCRAMYAWAYNIAVEDCIEITEENEDEAG
jgi:hypothetical protein